ncbi:MAG: gamma-glutamyltransferase, partial [Armatimonadota bacterium]
NNEMDDFATVPGRPNQFGLVQSRRNAVAPRKRPLSSMSPTIVEDAGGQVRMAAGSPGGPTIINVVLQVLLNGIDHGMDVAAAVGAPRIHHQWLPDELVVEPGFRDAIQGLRGLGHGVVERRLGDVQAVFVVDREATGASDPRHCGRTIVV